MPSLGPLPPHECHSDGIMVTPGVFLGACRRGRVRRAAVEEHRVAMTRSEGSTEHRGRFDAQCFEDHSAGTTMMLLFGLIGCLSLLSRPSHGWCSRIPPLVAVRRNTDRLRTTLHFSSANESQKDDTVRMALVRSLQMQFYKNVTQSELDLSQGMIRNLPLWRVPWVELPGRTNVLNVHEGLYTNMMEKILHSEPPWFVGHLYLPGGSDNIKSDNPLLKLSTWEEQAANRRLMKKDPMKRSAVLGTLMRISDYRRLRDGRLLVLVQAMERFVVSEVVQTLPYGIAHVQLLPDVEEVDSEMSWIETQTEDDVAAARALALKDSFEGWHRYEYENTMLPLPLRSELESEDIVGSALAQVLPFASFSPVIKAEAFSRGLAEVPKLGDSLRAPRSMPTLEQRLIQGRILQVPPELNPSLLRVSTEELEVELWLAINQFLKTTRTPVSPVILGLLPHRHEWPGNFVLERIGSAIGDQTQLKHKYVRTSDQYPALRRQKRFGYCAAALLEQHDTASRLRNTLLTLPSSKHRLAYILQYFQETFGNFQ